MRKLLMLGLALAAISCVKPPKSIETTITFAKMPPGRTRFSTASGVNCTAPTQPIFAGVCGNGVVNYGEECDDGNTVAGDGCSPVCLSEDPAADIFSATNGNPLHAFLAATRSPAVNSDTNEFGKARFTDDADHVSYNDPLVDPCHPAQAHLHVFMGNQSTDAYTVDEPALLSAQSSTAMGDVLNRSAYWVSLTVYPQEQRDPVTGVWSAVLDSTGAQAWQRVMPLNNYKTDENGVPVLSQSTGLPTYTNEGPFLYYAFGALLTTTVITPMPFGLRMIAGNHSATPSTPQDAGIVKWNCMQRVGYPTVPGMPASTFNHIPACPIGTLARMTLNFPQCWDGVHLDTADHKSHVAYPQSFKLPNGQWSPRLVCPSKFPVAIPQLVFVLQYLVTTANAGSAGSSAGWYLSSDMYAAGYGGYSGHGDFFDGWNMRAMNALVANCLNGHRSCANGDLGNNWRMSTQLPGTGDFPAATVINRGEGDGVTEH